MHKKLAHIRTWLLMLNGMDPTAGDDYYRAMALAYCQDYINRHPSNPLLPQGLLYLDVDPNLKLETVKQLLKWTLDEIADYIKVSSTQKRLSDYRINWLGLLFIAVTFFISLPLLALHSWYYRGTVNFLNSDGTVFKDNMLSLIRDYERYKERKAASNHRLIQSEPPQLIPVRNTPVDNLAPNPIQAPSNSTSPCTDIIPYNPIQFIPVQRPPLHATPAPIQTPQSAPSTFSTFFPSVNEIFSTELFLRETGKPIVIDSRVRPSHPEINDELVIDVYCKFKYSHQKPITITLSFMTKLDSSWQPRLEPEPEQPAQEPPSLVSKAWSGLNQGYRFFVPERNFQSICNEAKNIVNQIQKPAKLYKEALTLAKNRSERLIAITGIIDSLAKEYEFEKKTPSNSSEAKWKWMEEITEQINDYVKQLPPGFQSLSPRVAGLKVEFATIFKLLQEQKIGEAAFIYRHLKNYAGFVQYACPNLVSVLYQLDAIFFLIQIPGYSIARNLDREPGDDELRKERMLVYIKGETVWCALVTPSGLIQRVPLEPSELGARADQVHANLRRDETVYCRENLERYDEFSSIIFDAIAPKGYFEGNFWGLQPYFAFSNLQEAYKQIKTYDDELAELFYQKSLAPIQLLMRACQYAGTHTPHEVQKRELELDDLKHKRRKQADEVYPTVLEKIDDARWTRLLEETEQDLKGLDIPEDREFDFRPIWPF